VHASKPLVYSAIAAFGIGVLHDAWETNSLDNTIPAVPAGFSMAATSTSVSMSTAVYIPNLITGDEYRIPPRDPREQMPFVTPPASQYIYKIG
jgi:hypothetical protein